jgi:hypothetical protein
MVDAPVPDCTCRRVTTKGDRVPVVSQIDTTAKNNFNAVWTIPRGKDQSGRTGKVAMKIERQSAGTIEVIERQ